MIKPKQISTRRIPKVTSIGEAKSQAQTQGQNRSGITLDELVAKAEEVMKMMPGRLSVANSKNSNPENRRNWQ